MKIGDKIKERRLKLGYTVDQVAEMLGKNRATIYRYENNEIENLPTTVLELLAKVLNTTPAHLMGWDETEEENMKELQVFQNNEFGQVRILTIENEPWFVGKDVADALGYSNSRDALSKHVDDEDKSDVAIHDGSQNRNMTIINESGLYSLIMSSQLPSAKKFKRWVTAEVLPTIRKTGIYQVKEETTANSTHKPSITFEQTLEIAKAVGKTPLCAMEHVFKVLKIFVPELEMPEPEPRALQGVKVVKYDLEFQKQLNKYLKENNLTICEFSRRSGLPKSNIWNWVNGKATPSMSNLRIIANIIGSDVNIFL